MSTEANDLLNRIRQQQAKPADSEAQALLATARKAPAPQPSAGFLDTIARNVAMPFNQGLVDLIGNPGNVAQYLRGNLLAEEGQEADGLIPRASRIAGASVPIGGVVSMAAKPLLGQVTPLLNKLGSNVILPYLERLGIKDTILKGAAATPLAGELSATLMAALGGEVAEEMGVDQSAGEVIGGLSTVVSPLIQAGRVASQQARYHMPGIRAMMNDKTRASVAMQHNAADPVAAAAKFDPDSPVSPLRQTEDERLIELEEVILREGNPETAKRVRQKRVEAQEKAAIDASSFGGDEALPSTILEDQSRQQIARAKQRADDAIAAANKSLEAIDPGDDVRDISAQGRDTIVDALKAGRKTERQLWEAVNQEIPRSLDNMTETVRKIISETGQFNKPDAILPEISKASKSQGVDGSAPDLKSIIADPGSFSMDDIGAALADARASQKPIVLRDVHGLRQSIQDEVRNELGKPSGANWGRIRQLRRLEKALLKDMSAGGLPELDAARDFSRELNKKFTKGKMGEVLGQSSRRVDRVPAADTFSAIVGSQFPERDIAQALKATPEIQPDIERFVRGNFLVAAVKDGVVNQAQANRFISNLRKKGVFNVLPDLEGQLTDAASKAKSAQTLKERADIVKQRGGARIEQQSKESVASTFLDKPVGEELSVLLEPKNVNRAQQLASKLRFRMGGNEAAESGLRTSFSKQLLNKAKMKDGLVSGEKFAELIEGNQATLRALGFDDGMIQRMRKSATILKQVQAKPSSDELEKIINDPKAFFYNNVAAIAGAKFASFVNRNIVSKLTGGSSGAGVSIQIANRGATAATRFSNLLENDKAVEMIADTIEDGKAMQDLLTRNNATTRQKKELQQRLYAWIPGAAVAGEDEDESD